MRRRRTKAISGEPVSGHEAYTRCIIKERLASVIELFWPREQYQMVEQILLILGQSTNDLDQYLKLDDSKIDCKIQHYAGLHAVFY